MYNPIKAKLTRAREELKEQMPGQELLFPKGRPVQIRVLFQFQRPLSHFVGRNRQNPLRDDAPTYHTAKPDLDNCMKFLGDVMSGLVYADDKQTVLVTMRKAFVIGPSLTEVRVRPWK